MNKEKQLLPIKNFNVLANFLQETTLKLSETITGFLISDKNDKKLIAGHIIQSIFKGNLLTQFGQELKNLRNKGLIKEDYFATHKQQATLLEFLKFIDGEETPDEERFKAMKSIFFASITKNITEDDEILTYQLMQICKKLSSAEILILNGAYAVVKNTGKKLLEGINVSNCNANIWAQIVSKKIGHNLPDIVFQHENHLMELKLITDRQYLRNNTEVPRDFSTSQYFRLTALGYKLCEFITKYE